jgi:hypothetical protein
MITSKCLLCRAEIDYRERMPEGMRVVQYKCGTRVTEYPKMYQVGTPCRIFPRWVARDDWDSMLNAFLVKHE